MIEVAPSYLQPAKPVRMRARYDNAQTTDENQKLWYLTDALSSKAANSFYVRRTLRIRSRYEVANNSYAFGIVDTNVNDLIGTGPTLQLATESDDINQKVEDLFAKWWDCVGGVSKLRVATFAKKQDGEGVLLLKSRPSQDDPVKLYLHEVETDQVTTPSPQYMTPRWVDGVEMDQFGNVKQFHVLKWHPGDVFMGVINPLEYDILDARYVLHWFKKTRPGQVRGIPELTPALNLFAEIRRFSKATLRAAEVAADIAGVVRSQGPANAEDAEDIAPFDAIDVEHGTLLTMPRGWDINQLKPEHPTTTFDTYVEKLIAEACRCLNVPLNVALGTSQKFNFSSARLDYINYRSALRVERQHCEAIVLNRIFRAWLEEALLIPGYLPAGIDQYVPFAWHWPGWEYMDPYNDAQADSERLRNKTTTLKRLLAEQGRDVNVELRQAGRERELMKQYDLIDQVGSSGRPVEKTNGPGNEPGNSGSGGN